MKKILLIIGLLLLGGVGFAVYTGFQAMKGVPATELEARYVTSADQFIEVADATIRLRDEGPRDAPVIFLIHGFSFSLESFDAWAADLSTDYRVIRYDLLGHGLTGPDDQQRYAPMERVAFLEQVMHHLNVDKAILGGNSLGGLIAWRFASEHPDRVTKLILVSPGVYSINGVAEDPVEVPAAIKAFFLTVPDAGIDATIDFVWADPGSVSPERRQLLADMLRREGNGQAFIQHLEEFTLPAPEAALAKVTAPTLILWGEEDSQIPVAHGTQLLSDLPNARLITYPGVGHVAHEEAPAVTLQDVRAFLDTSSDQP